MSQGGHEHLRRLRTLYPRQRLYFITTGTHLHHPILTRSPVAEILIDEWQSATARHGWLVGRYVVMPDHVHFFCANAEGRKSLSGFVGAWKEWTAKRARRESLHESGTTIPTRKVSRFWQPAFFDRLLRSRESYAAKWDYVWRNPVRAGLVQYPQDWPWQGEVQPLQGPDE